MKKNYLFLATAAVLMASCANDDFSGDNTSSPTGTGAIAFNMNTPAMSRGEGTTENTHAKALGNEFIVWGEKNENNSGKQADDADVVFKNYRVQYTASSANTTESNTKDWEYVGITPYNYKGTAPSNGATGDESNAFVAPSIYTSTAKQTIKYWDFGKNYTFTAVSAKQDDIKKQLVKITKNTGYAANAADTATVYAKGYTIELAADASTKDVYLSDRVTKKLDSKSTESAAADAVQMTFRNFQSKIRFGIYETVPGYKVVITGIKYNNGSTEVTHPTAASEGGSSDKTFGVDGNFVVAGKSSTEGSKNTKYTVTYTSDNKAQVSIADGYNSNSYLNTGGTEWLSTSPTSPVGTSATNPTWDNVTTTTSGEGDSQTTTKTSNWTSIMPNPSNNTELKLHIAYKLISEDTGEVIEFKETSGNTTTEVFRTVTVPAEYCQWKSNYAYTYLFKISDKSAELYPITFDACVETEDNGNWESITEVSEPSITTFAVTSTSNKTIVTGKNEYEAGNIIYATVMELNSSNKYETATLSNTSGSENIALYTVTSSDNFPITEASVAQAIVSTASSKKLTCTKVEATTTSNGSTTTNWELVNEVPAEDGTTVKLAESDKKALKWTAESGKTYAIQYTKDNKQYYKIVKVASTN